MKLATLIPTTLQQLVISLFIKLYWKWTGLMIPDEQSKSAQEHSWKKFGSSYPDMSINISSNDSNL